MRTRDPTSGFAMRRTQPTTSIQSVYALLFLLLGILFAVIFDLRSVLIRPKPLLLTNNLLAYDDGIIRKQAVPQGDITRGGFMFYFYNARMLVTIHQKTGTTSFWKWIYKGLTNKTFNCDTFVQDVGSPCWKPHVRAWWSIPLHERESILSDPGVLRVAIHRDPLDRVISCWKSKFACRNTSYTTDPSDLWYMMNALTELISQSIGSGSTKPLSSNLNLTNRECLSIDEYAHMLDIVSDGIDSGRVNVFRVESHLRPQIYFYQYINYSLIMPVDQLENVSMVKPIVDRLPFIPDGTACGHEHSSNGSALVISEKTASMLARYASWSERAWTKPLHWVPQVYNSDNL